MTELLREAMKDGRRVALLRCYDGEGATIVEYESEPTGRRGTYRFASAPEAFRFVQEALLAMQYLGCTISS
ncbi:MAG TPA: hypothetical protein VGU02_00005 [Gaiellaceae bacterium]|nr:hypothetical protein [Gaiellaceae bacterium]